MPMQRLPGYQVNPMLQRLPGYQVNPMLDLSPISNALTGYQRQMNINDQAQFQEREYDDARKQREAERIGRIAQMYLGETDPNRKQALGSGMLRLHPNMVGELQNAGIDTNDHGTVASFLLSQTGSYDPSAAAKSKADLDYKQAQTELARSQAGLFRARASAASAAPAPAAPAPDPLAGAGLDEDGNIIQPNSQPQRGSGVLNGSSLPPPPDKFMTSGATVPGTGVTVVPDRFQPPMKLGGPMDDIDRSMRLDEGRPQGVRVAQAGGGAIPSVPGIRPDLMNQAMGQFGATGMTSPEVPGVVTDAGRNKRVDVPATREMQGQRAFNQASPEQQDRLMKFRQDQELWTGVYKRPPRAGYYYGNDGREMALTDKNFKGDRENQAVALMNMNKVEQASKKLLDSNYVTRTLAGLGNIGEIGQAFADMKQGALGIAYALSGKTVAVAEMKNFIEAYGPTPGDSAERIQAKTQRMRDFYQALLTASRGGESYETAFARAMASTGLKNPDGTPAGAPAAASGGTRAAAPQNNDIRSLPTDELVRRLNGGR